MKSALHQQLAVLERKKKKLELQIGSSQQESQSLQEVLFCVCLVFLNFRICLTSDVE
jgi:hypothetical protein